MKLGDKKNSTKNDNQDNENKSFFNKIMTGIGIKEKENDLSAEYAWIETTYGEGSFQTLQERIKNKQRNIRNTIISKFPSRCDTAKSIANTDTSYYCVVKINEDLSNYIDEIFEPFKDRGFEIFNLSEKLKEIDEENVFIISWKNVFKKKELK